MTETVRLRELTLCGFGIYEKPTRFLLPTGPGIFWGANETGKSTFLWGVAAVWFGLPGTSDPSRVGTKRFRSLSDPAEFWGELVWSDEHRSLRLHRDFDTHKVRLVSELESGEKTVLYDGEHNPSGRSSAGTAFPEELRKLLGVSSLELYLETFCLTQPLPDENSIGSELQHLISGSRAVKVDDVLSKLFEQVKTLTRSTGEFGLVRPGTSRPTNQRENGRVEELESKLASARLDLELARTQLEEFNRGNEELEQTQEGLTEIQSRIEARSRRLRTLERWTKENQERHRRAERVQLLVNALGQLDEIERERISLRTTLDEQYPEFAGTAPELSDRLEAVERAAEDVKKSLEEASELAEHRQERESEQSTIRESLDSEFADLGDRSDWGQCYRRLADAVDDRQKQQESLAELESEIERRRADLEMSEALGGVTIETCRAQAGAIVDAYARACSLEKQLKEIQAQMEERSYLEEDSRFELLRENVALETELKECSVQIREQKASVAIASEALREAETRKESTDFEIPELEQIQQSTTDSRMQIGRVSLPLASGVCLALAFAVWQFASWSVPTSLGLAGGLFLVLQVLNRFLPEQKPAAQRPQDLTPGERLRRRMESNSTSEIRRRTLSRGVERAEPGRRLSVDQAREELEQAESRLEEIRKREREIESRIEALRLDLGPYAATTPPEMAKMEERWRLLDQQKQRLEEERSELLEDRFGVDDEDWLYLPAVEASETVEQLLYLPGGPDPDEGPELRELLDWLSRLEDTDWEAFAAAESARNTQMVELTELRTRRKVLTEQLSDQQTLADLQDRLQPFTLESDLETLEHRVAERDRLRRRLAAIADGGPLAADSPTDSSLDSGPDSSSPTVPETIQTLNSRIDELQDAGAHPPKPETDDSTAWTVESTVRLAEWSREQRAKERPAREGFQQLDALEQSETRILRAEGFQTRPELDAKKIAEESALGVAIRELEELESRELELASTDAHDPEEKARSLADLRDRDWQAQKDDQLAIRSLEETIRQQLREKAALEGRSVPNVASLELEITRMESDLSASIRDRDALVTAFRWTRTAADDYRTGYRASLESQISRHFAELTGDRGRRITVSESFALGVVDGQGNEMVFAQLSQGARDQLVLAIRLGVADLLADSVPLPFFFDDPFVHFDDRRLEEVRGALDRLGKTRQWVLLTHRREMADWGDPIFTESQTVAEPPELVVVAQPSKSPKEPRETGQTALEFGTTEPEE